MLISDWSSDVSSSDLGSARFALDPKMAAALAARGYVCDCGDPGQSDHPASDLHLMPDGPRDEGWDTDDVCRLAVILLGGTPDAPATTEPALTFARGLHPLTPAAAALARLGTSQASRSEERRVGKRCVSPGRSLG